MLLLLLRLTVPHRRRNRGAVRANAPTQKIVWGHCSQTLPSSSYKYIKYFYIVRFVNSYQQLSPISVETAFAQLWCHNTYLFSNRVH